MKVYNLEGLNAVLELPREEILQLLKQGELEGKRRGDEWQVSERQVREFLDKEFQEEKIYQFW